MHFGSRVLQERFESWRTKEGMKMPEETFEQSEMDGGFDAGWLSSTACSLIQLRDQSPAWLSGYEQGRRARELLREWGGPVPGPESAPLAPFCVMPDVPADLEGHPRFLELFHRDPWF